MSSPELRDPRLIPTDDASPFLREIKSARIDATRLAVEFVDGCELNVPLTFFPTLMLAGDDERQNFEVLPYSLNWDALDCHLGVEGLLCGAREDARLAEKARRRFQQQQHGTAAA
jgi:hypothetical protein